MSYSRAPGFGPSIPLACAVMSLGAALVVPGLAYAQCSPVPPGSVALATAADSCTDDTVARSSSVNNTPAINVTGGLYTGNAIEIRTTADFAHGAAASGLGSIDLTGGSLLTIGVNAYGIQATGDGTVTARDLTIETQAKGASGVVTTGSGSVALTTVNVLTVGDSASGLWADGGGDHGQQPHHQGRGN